MPPSEYTIFSALLGQSDPSTLQDWFEASFGLSSNELSRRVHALDWTFNCPPYDQQLQTWIKTAELNGLFSHLPLDTIEQILASAACIDAKSAAAELFWREHAIKQLAQSRDEDLPNALLASAEAMVGALTPLFSTQESTLKARMLALWPDLGALCHHNPDTITTEHEKIGQTKESMPLLEHLVDRCLARKLRGLEIDDIGVFQRDSSLSPDAFQAEVDALATLFEHGLDKACRAALLFLDFTKGGSAEMRTQWKTIRPDLSIHNEASADIVASKGLLKPFGLPECFEKLVLALIRSHGLVGQCTRGEAPLTAFDSWIEDCRSLAPELSEMLALDSTERAYDLIHKCLHLLNLCDTAGVREGLMTDSLRFEFMAVESLLNQISKGSQAAFDELLRCEASVPREDPLWENAQRRWLFDRICRLRAGRIRAGEPEEEALRVVKSLSVETLEAICGRLRQTSLWYMEVATSSLSPESQIKLLAGALSSSLPNITFIGLVRDLDRASDPSSPYRVRLIETLLRQADIDQLIQHGFDSKEHALGGIKAQIGSKDALNIKFEASEEARALLTLLPLYERKSNAAFHATLKGLCDLYGLRKDEFDRISNENTYLLHMNSARSDKERMLDYVPDNPELIVEIGPGGGVVLDLLEARFPNSRIAGIDISKLVVESLQSRREIEGHRWEVLEGDAFHLEAHFSQSSCDALIFCSLLHEIYSYVEYDTGKNSKEKFRLESVRDLLRSAFRALKPGGRIIIRDGVMPPDEPRYIRFKDPDGPEFFRLFQEQFEGRKIFGEWMDEVTVRTFAPDAMEFLYCYTWGPESFPYEVREQYGVLPYEEYQEAIVAWLGAECRSVEVTDGSYLQEGYIQGLKDKIDLFDEHMHPVSLPDSNAILVFEKKELL